jgi:hypothetical protein
MDSALIDEIGNTAADHIKISTRGFDIDRYKLVETGVDTGIFTGEVTLVGFDFDADGDSTNEAATSGGNSLSKYISRTVTLAEGQDAEDINVYLTAYKPGTATIKVYHKLVNAEDSAGIAETPWVEMTQDTVSSIVSDNINTEDFNEYKYVINSASLTGASGEYQYVSNSVTYTGFKHFAIKIVLLSTDPSNPPRVKDFRTIALQI